jgi:hypothetical protein
MCFCVALASSTFANAQAGRVTSGVVNVKISNLQLTLSSSAE